MYKIEAWGEMPFLHILPIPVDPYHPTCQHGQIAAQIVEILVAANKKCQISLQMPPPIIESNATTSDIPDPTDPFQINAALVTAGVHALAA